MNRQERGVSVTMINKRYAAILIVVLGVALLSGCGGTDDTSESAATKNLKAASYLPESVEALSIARTSEVSTYVGETLYEYINGGAEIYHLYHFVEVATAYYQLGDVEIIADVYQFATSEGAFGMLTTLRDPELERVEYGAAGFRTGSSTDFVKGHYLIRLTGFDESESTQSLITSFAAYFAELIPGTSELPSEFRLFPEGELVAASETIHAEAFLGRGYLNNAHLVTMVAAGDTLTLFLIPNEGQYQKWYDEMASDGKASPLDAPLGFDQGVGFQTESSFYGTIIAGEKGSWLAGVRGYQSSHADFVTAWLATLK